MLVIWAVFTPLFQLECVVQGLHGQFHVFAVDQHGYLDLGRGDDLDVDAFVAQGGEHFGGDTRVAAHADTDDRYLGHTFVSDQIVIVDVVGCLGRFHGLLCARHLIDGAGERHIGAPVLGYVLHDHIDVHARL